MAERWDAIVVGGGHNGLVCAAYLARAGRSVLVLERRETLGGTAATEEVMPGYRASLFPSVGTFSPEILGELGLVGHGLEIAEPGGVFVATGGDDALWLPPPGKPLSTAVARAIGERSRADADAFERLDGLLRRLAAALEPLLGRPLPDPAPAAAGGWLELLRPLLRLRRLGRDDLEEALRLLPMPLFDVAGERFELEPLRLAVAAGGLRASWLGPRSPGGAATLLFHRCGLARGAIGHPRLARGGSGALVDALERAARAAGAEIRAAAPVSRIAVAGGRATGVVLAGGEELAADVVVSCADPRTTLLELVAPEHLEPSFLFAARAIRARGTVGVVHFALDALPPFPGAPEHPHFFDGRFLVARDLESVERAFDAAKYGRLPERPWVELTFPSVHDPALAPAGRHLATAWAQYPPRELREGGWDARRDELGDAVARVIEEAASGFTARVVDRRVLTPADLEARYGLPGGHPYHVEPALDQLLYLRPLPRWGRHRTPVAGLYLGSVGTHGGLGLSGLQGRNAARAVIADAS